MGACTNDLDELVHIAREHGWHRIGVDGADGAGKSSLAKRLAIALGKRQVDIDNFVEKGQGGYGAFIDYMALHAAGEGSDVVISGACLRDVLKRSRLDVDAYVYVKRMRPGYWADEETCVFPAGVNAAITKQEAMHGLVEKHGAMPGAVVEIMRYHDKARPHERADVVFTRESED
jgi:hypothetical protein